MDVITKICKPSNTGTLTFFLLNFGLVVHVCSGVGSSSGDLVTIAVLYVLLTAIAISPVGEMVLTVYAGGHEIKRRDVKIKLIPLLEAVYDRAVSESPNMVKSIHLKISNDPNPNAYAIGRHTIVVTEGLLDLPDSLIMGALAHEVGHLANRHSEIQLLIGGSNVFITGFLLALKLVTWTVAAIGGLFALGLRSRIGGILVAIFTALCSACIFAWTKFCLLFLHWSMRNNEYVADEYAYKIGFGRELAAVLDQYIDAPSSGFLRALYDTHPSIHDRIAHLQDLGVNYSRWQ